MLLEAFATLELEIANKGKMPTYFKGGKGGGGDFLTDALGHLIKTHCIYSYLNN